MKCDKIHECHECHILCIKIFYPYEKCISYATSIDRDEIFNLPTVSLPDGSSPLLSVVETISR